MTDWQVTKLLSEADVLRRERDALAERVRELTEALDVLRFKTGVDCWCGFRPVRRDEQGFLIEDDFAGGHDEGCEIARVAYRRGEV